MARVFPTSREVAQPIIEALKETLSVDDYGIHTERRNEANDVVVWYEVSILSHEEFLRLIEIAASTHSRVAVLPDDKSRMKVELYVSLK